MGGGLGNRQEEGKVFTEALFGNTQKLLALLSNSPVLKDAYLAGGTAAALQLGHRISVDLDFFTPCKFDAKRNAQRFAGILRKSGDFSIEQISWGTIQGYFKEVRFSLFVYEYPVLFPLKKFHRIRIIDLRDIAAMKVAAICDRGTKRDFVDLYFICNTGVSLPHIMRLYDRKYKKLGANLLHIQKSLVYFDDAEKDEMPKMLKETSWPEIKSYFERGTRKLAELY